MSKRYWFIGTQDECETIKNILCSNIKMVKTDSHTEYHYIGEKIPIKDDKYLQELFKDKWRGDVFDTPNSRSFTISYIADHLQSSIRWKYAITEKEYKVITHLCANSDRLFREEVFFKPVKGIIPSKRVTPHEYLGGGINWTWWHYPTKEEAIVGYMIRTGETEEDAIRNIVYSEEDDENCAYYGYRIHN